MGDLEILVRLISGFNSLDSSESENIHKALNQLAIIKKLDIIQNAQKENLKEKTAEQAKDIG